MALLAILAIPLHAQRLVIGERVPDLNITQWLNGAPVSDGKAVMVEFYHSSNPKGAERLAQLDELAKSYGDRLAVTSLALNTISLEPGESGYYELQLVSPIMPLDDVLAAIG